MTSTLGLFVIGALLLAPPLPDADLVERLFREEGGMPLTVVYDVRDLTARINDAVPAVETGLTGGASLEQPVVSRLTVERVIELITTEVAPESWNQPRSEGGGTIQRLNDNLIITALPDRHDRIEEMLSAIRARFALNVVVDLCFIDEGDEPFELELVRKALPPSDTGAWLAGAASAEAFETIQRSVDETRGPGAVLARPRLIVLDGQAASVVVSSMMPVDLPVAGRPGRTMTVRPLDGVAVWLRPRVSDDRTSVRLALEPRMARVDVGGDIHEHAAHAEIAETIGLGETLAVRLPVETTHLARVRLAGDTVAAFEREPCPEHAEARTVLVLARARLVNAAP